MEIHFHESTKTVPGGVAVRIGWKETEAAIKDLPKVIHTTQMGLLSTRLLDAGYHIFIHEPDGEVWTIQALCDGLSVTALCLKGRRCP